ncbi:hypothetical protein [Olleya marilimosa]|uniref:hypothetical protein n=1 Tax=Olleya marilimosa TaxID=272164 RepID=UPI0030EBAB45|tara:strand:- start:132812 stop:133198 length:387 start_codon:yes stop_codon:yes gene_type:complete
MEFKNIKKRKADILSAVLWMAFGLSFFLIDNQKNQTLQLLAIPMVLFYLYSYFLDKRNLYKIENDTIKTVGLFVKSFNLKELNRVNRNDFGLKLVSDNQNEFLIDRRLLSIQDFKTIEDIIVKYESKI